MGSEEIKRNFKEDLPKVKMLVLDVDGVLSRECASLAKDAQPIRTINTKDGFAIKYAAENGLRLAIITGGKAEEIPVWYKRLGVEDIYLRASYKLPFMKELLTKYNLSPEEVMYMGDDLPDLEVLKYIGMPTCPSDAVAEVKEASRYISPYKGGEGCVRDVVEQIMKSQGKWLTESYVSW